MIAVKEPKTNNEMKEYRHILAENWENIGKIKGESDFGNYNAQFRFAGIKMPTFPSKIAL